MDYHHHQVQLHCRVCAKRMFDRRENKKDTTTSVRHILRPCRRCLVWHFNLRRMQWCTHKAFVAPASVPFKRQWMQLQRGVPYKCCVTAFQWQTHSRETCMVRCLHPNMMACVLISLNPHNRQVCEHFISTQQVGRPPKVIHPAKERPC